MTIYKSISRGKKKQTSHPDNHVPVHRQPVANRSSTGRSRFCCSRWRGRYFHM